jgi:hypothetical protein
VWKINEKTLPTGIVLPAGSPYEKSVALKSRLHEKWLVANPERRFALAQFYVSTWGGVKRNKDAILKRYISQEPRSLMRQGVKGIASWSKVLCIRNPYKYAIFDARVSAALNCMQVVERVERGMLFPWLPGQNKFIQAANASVRDYARDNEWACVEKTNCYETYLALLVAVAKQCDDEGTEISALEMLLFSRVEQLASSAFPSVRAGQQRNETDAGPS